jgi:hypothetical protein
MEISYQRHFVITKKYFSKIKKKIQDEKVFVIAITLLSCIVFAYSMNSIGKNFNLLKFFNKKKKVNY